MNNIYFLGPNGSFSHSIAQKVYASKHSVFVPCNGFLDIVHAVLESKTGIGVLPIENSITSDIHENIDYLFKNNLTIIAEAYLRIHLHLIGHQNGNKESIRTVYSHPRALAQCTKYIKTHSLNTIETGSTSAARDHILKTSDRTEAVIGSTDLSAGSSLKILDSDIGDDPFNLTRFVFVSYHMDSLPTQHTNKTTIIFTLPHTPGSLAKVLTSIANMKGNLTKIESRPIPGTEWEYLFWVDIEMDNQETSLVSLTNHLKKEALSFKVIGMYQRGTIYDS